MPRRRRPATPDAPLEAWEQYQVTLYVRGLGFSDLDAYQAWCGENGLSDALRKTPKQKRRWILWTIVFSWFGFAAFHIAMSLDNESGQPL